MGKAAHLQQASGNTNAGQEETDQTGNPVDGTPTDPDPDADDDNDQGGGDGNPDEGDDDAKKVTAALAQASSIAALCAKSGVPHLAAGFISAGMSVEQVKGRVDTAAQIRALVAEAAKTSPAIKADSADALIAQGATVETASAAILQAILTNQAPAIQGHAPVERRPAAPALDVAAVWDAYNRR